MKEAAMRQWPLQDAKARFSEVVKRAASEGPQGITLRGEPAAVLVSRADYARLTGTRGSLATFLAASPLAGLDLEFARDKSPGRKVRL